MCHESCISFGENNLNKDDVKGKDVIEIGSQNVNGSLRYYIENLECKKYIGVDIEKGIGVDIVCKAENVIEIFGKDAFDIVICTELLEHVKDWKSVISNIKNICKPGGTILVTTRSYGFPRHGYPYDYWRYEIEDIKNIFSDCIIEILEKDYQMPGVFAKIKKEYNFIENDLSEYKLFEINTNRKIEFDKRLKVLIGIPTYNGAHRLDWLLQSISMRTGNYIDYKIVICDDSGNKEHQEKTRDVINKWNSTLPINLLINDINIGVAKSWNRITTSEDSQYIILVNDDIIVVKNWLENMVYFLDNNPNAGAACYDFVMMDERDTQFFLNLDIKDCYNNMNIRPIRQMDALGCLFCFRREMYDLIGGFDENYFTNFEETDFFTSLASHGHPIYVLQCPKILHVYSATFKTSPELDYWKRFNNSKEYYTKKWNGDKAEVSKRYMCEIPFQKVKWLCDNNAYEEILIDDYGYFQVEINTENEEIKLKA